MAVAEIRAIDQFEHSMLQLYDFAVGSTAVGPEEGVHLVYVNRPGVGRHARVSYDRAAQITRPGVNSLADSLCLNTALSSPY